MPPAESSRTEERTRQLEAEVAVLRREVAMLKTPKGRPPSAVATHGETELHPIKGRGLTELEQHHDERIRTLCFVICAGAVVYGCIYILRSILVPFFLALAFKYMLTPLIMLLSCHKDKYPGCKYRLPRGFAIFLAIMVAISVLSFICMLVIRSVMVFSENAGMYNERLKTIVDKGFETFTRLNAQMHGNAPPPADVIDGMAFLQTKLGEIDLSAIITSFLDKTAGVAEDLLYIVLFLVFMLVGDKGGKSGRIESDEANEQIYVYIRGKLLLSCLVGGAHGLILFLIGSDLWLVFLILTFSLNFVPNVGMFLAVALPMPLVALDPQFGPLQVAAAFFGPGLVGVVSKDVLEPLLIGNSTSLQPVALMLAIMVWGSVWGLTGMILAVPMTAVMRIHLAHIEHPLTHYIASALDGSDGKQYKQNNNHAFETML